MNVPLKCRCGALQGMARDISSATAKRIVCLCDDCQAYAHFLGRAKDVLDENGGTEVFPVAPSKLEITQGLENLKCLRLGEKGMYRWYAGCCQTPIANSMPSAGIPFAGVLHTIMYFKDGDKSRDAVLGPVYARVQGRWGIGRLPAGTSQTAPLGAILSTLRFLLVGFVKRRHRPSPFFDARTGQPVVAPYVLTPAEREGLRKFCGPQPVA